MEVEPCSEFGFIRLDWMVRWNELGEIEMKIRSRFMSNMDKLDESFHKKEITENQYGMFVNMFLLEELAVLTAKNQIKQTEFGYVLNPRVK
jgi:hypothetical protein